jgi:hypothetical protein
MIIIIVTAVETSNLTRNAYFLVGIIGGKRPVRRSRLRENNNIKMYPKQTGPERLE